MLNLVVADLVEKWMVKMRHVEAWFLHLFATFRVYKFIFTIFFIILFCLGSSCCNTACFASVGVILAFLTRLLTTLPAFLSSFLASIYAFDTGFETVPVIFNNSDGLNFLVVSFNSILYPSFLSTVYVSLLNLFLPLSKLSLIF